MKACMAKALGYVLALGSVAVSVFFTELWLAYGLSLLSLLILTAGIFLGKEDIANGNGSAGCFRYLDFVSAACSLGAFLLLLLLPEFSAPLADRLMYFQITLVISTFFFLFSLIPAEYFDFSFTREMNRTSADNRRKNEILRYASDVLALCYLASATTALTFRPVTIILCLYALFVPMTVMM